MQIYNTSENQNYTGISPSAIYWDARALAAQLEILESISHGLCDEASVATFFQIEAQAPHKPTTSERKAADAAQTNGLIWFGFFKVLIREAGAGPRRQAVQLPPPCALHP